MSDSGKARLEILRPAAGRKFACALLDFDGTLSLIRQGWQDVMVPVMVEILRGLDHGLSGPELEELVREDVETLTGKQTIYQMIRLAERVEQFGGTPGDPLEYKQEYNRRLMARIEHRRRALAERSRLPGGGGQTRRGDEMLLRGARAMLEALRQRGLKLYLTSGTDEPYVLEEANLLGIADYFDGGIYGAREDYGTFSKAKVIRRMLTENAIDGKALLSLGDGFVEIVETRAVGGYAVGVASDEARGGGQVDPWKRDRLIRAGADMIVPDFAEPAPMLAALFGSEGQRP